MSDVETYTFLLDRWSPETAFHNYGMDGYATENELVVYENVSDRYDHRLVVLGYYAGNDMQTNLRKTPLQPQFGVRNGTLVQTQEPRLRTIRAGRCSTRSPTAGRSTRSRRRWPNTR